MYPAAMLVALIVDVCVGWPNGLYRAIGHPVGWIGRVISAAEQSMNRGNGSARRAKGSLLVLVLVGFVWLVAWRICQFLPGGLAEAILTGILAWPLVAARALHVHVANVGQPLEHGDIEGARAEVSKIVGRNPQSMGEGAIGRAALESLAENSSDGVIAPLFWGAIFGLPGIAVYKTINTLDSMIGYRNDRYREFGWAAARLDDLVNLVPARLTGLLICGAAVGVRRTTFRTMLRDAGRHRSPNAGWPEAAMAGALGVRLSGPRVYDDRETDDPWLNPVANDPRAEDIGRGLRLYRRAVGSFGAILLILAVI